VPLFRRNVICNDGARFERLDRRWNDLQVPVSGLLAGSHDDVWPQSFNIHGLAIFLYEDQHENRRTSNDGEVSFCL
jgi:hypothetical protein